MAIPVSELQSISPSSVIELFVLTLDPTLHGSSDSYRFHNGSAPDNNDEVIWAGNSYMRYPIQVTGFEQSGKGALPRPHLVVSNILSTMTAVIQEVNITYTPGNDLCGAEFLRIRTLARYLDADNWETGVNPFGTPSPSTELPREIYKIDRKIAENRNVIEWECASAFDLSYGAKAP
tara:strand:- start:44 stop:574 length:531 start_codon:yes stop_codon:yes gene_type:complete